MKKTILIVLLAIALGFAAGTVAEARTKTTSSDRIESRMSAPDRGDSSGVGFHGGISSLYPIPNGGGSFGGSLTGIIQMTQLDAIQLLMAIGGAGTDMGFSFGIGGLYKRTLFGGETGGFHLGGGLGLGTYGSGGAGATSTDFAMTIPVVTGVHFKIPNTGVSFHFDGGPSFSLLAATTTRVAFTIGQLSALMGASVVYEF